MTSKRQRFDYGPNPDCPRCRGTGEEPNAQFRCACRWTASCDCWDVHENVGGRAGCQCHCHESAERPTRGFTPSDGGKATGSASKTSSAGSPADGSARDIVDHGFAAHPVGVRCSICNTTPSSRERELESALTVLRGALQEANWELWKTYGDNERIAPLYDKIEAALLAVVVPQGQEKKEDTRQSPPVPVSGTGSPRTPQQKGSQR